MKTRTSFVSNSSSSSFVVIPQKQVKWLSSLSEADLAERSQYVVDEMRKEINAQIEESSEPDKKTWSGLFRNGERQFGWQTRIYLELESKWNWLVLQAYYGGEDGDIHQTNEFRGRIDGWLESYGLATIDWNMVEKLDNDLDAYIDHQSIDSQATFDEVDRIGIEEFLFNPNCFIQNGNDNGD